MLLGLATMAYVGAAAVEKPNFSGEWKMNAAKSNYGDFPGPASYLRKIAHVDENITIVSTQSGGNGDGTSTLKLTTDGTPVRTEINRTTVVASAKLDGNALITSTKVESIGVEFSDRMTLSDDGKELVSVVEVTSTQGKVELRIVFDRQ
jgi:hypothetical protein